MYRVWLPEAKFYLEHMQLWPLRDLHNAFSHALIAFHQGDILLIKNHDFPVLGPDVVKNLLGWTTILCSFYRTSTIKE